MSVILKQLGALALVGWSLQTSTLCAQAPGQTAAPPAPAAAATANVVVTEGTAPSSEPTTSRPFKRIFNSHGMCCASDFNQFGCGNFWSEATFILGSCRTFFGQPCYPNSPHFGLGGTRGGGGQKCCGN